MDSDMRKTEEESKTGQGGERTYLSRIRLSSPQKAGGSVDIEPGGIRAKMIIARIVARLARSIRQSRERHALVLEDLLDGIHIRTRRGCTAVVGPRASDDSLERRLQLHLS
jgi:hypothetical protein